MLGHRTCGFWFSLFFCQEFFFLLRFFFSKQSIQNIHSQTFFPPPLVLACQVALVPSVKEFWVYTEDTMVNEISQGGMSKPRWSKKIYKAFKKEKQKN